MYEWPEYSLVVGEKLVRISIKQHCIEPRQRWYKHSEQTEVKKKKRSPQEKRRKTKDTRSENQIVPPSRTLSTADRIRNLTYLWK